MMIPVHVQRPNDPKSERYVGEASSDATVEQVAKLVGVPDGCLIDGKVSRRNGRERWSLVANVTFSEGPHRLHCPHCGGVI